MTAPYARPMPRALAGVLAAVTLTATASAASAADQTVAIANFAFAPSTVTVTVGDTVTWRFAGPDTNHSVTSTSGPAFDSDPGRMPTSLDHLQGSTYAHRFDAVGTFDYICKVHPNMIGTVAVSPAPGPGVPPPPTADTTAPIISGLKASRTGSGASSRRVLGLVLSEAARVTVTLRRGSATVKLVRRLPRGRSRVRLPKTLRPGRYAATVKATDAAGNTATARKLALTVATPR